MTGWGTHSYDQVNRALGTDARQVLHVAFGSVLERYGAELKAFLAANEEAYYTALEGHFQRHFKAFKENLATEDTEGTE